MNEICIKAFGISCPQAQGTEIVITGIITGTTWHNAAEIFDDSWLKKDTTYNWRSWDNHEISDTISADLPKAENIILVLEKNRWRGICEITYQDRKRQVDCYYDSDESDLLMIPLANETDKPASFLTQITNFLKRKQDIFFRKKLCVLGDSYARNHCRPYTETWHFLFALKHQMEYCNYGINGNGLVGRAFQTVPMLERYRQIPEDADYIFVMGGKNDYNIQLDAKIFRGGLQRLIQGLRDRYPRAEIIFFTPWKIAFEDRDDPNSIKLRIYAEIILDVCHSFHVPVFDASKSGISVWQPEFRKRYMQGPDDVSHLNVQGHQMMLKEAESFLKRVVRKKR